MSQTVPTTAYILRLEETTNGTGLLPFGHTLSPQFSILTGTLFLLIIIMAILGNSILIYTILTVKRLHSVTHAFLVNLAVGDLVTATLTIPFDVDYMWRRYFPYGTLMCGVSQIGFFISLPSSVINLSLLTVERFVTIAYPYRRDDWFRRRNVVILLFATWVYTLLVALSIVINDPDAVFVYHGICMVYPMPKGYPVFQLVVNFILPMSVIVLLNIRIFAIANKHKGKIKKVSVPQMSSESTSMTRFSIGTNLKAAKRILLLVGVCAVCWLTYIICVAHNMTCGGCHPREVTWITNIINYSSTAINPLLYGMTSKPIRHQLWKRVRQYKCCNTTQSTLRSTRRHGVTGLPSETQATEV